MRLSAVYSGQSGREILGSWAKWPLSGRARKSSGCCLANAVQYAIMLRESAAS